MLCPSCPAFLARRLAAAALASLALGTGGCSVAARHSSSQPAPSPLASRGAATALAPTAARRAALRFAHSYVASRNHPRRPVTTGAAVSLASQLRVNSRYLADHPPAAHARLLGVSIEVEGASGAEATAILSLGSSHRRLAIRFVLRLGSSGWLAVALRGNAA